jgi:hypothetical protein
LSGVYESIKKFFEYYKNTCIIEDAEHTKCSRYEPIFWYFAERIINDTPRFTNPVEGWDCVLNNSTLVSHQNIEKFIQIIKKEYGKTITTLKQVQEG